MLAKGNRSKAVAEACKENGGFYLGSIGGPAAIIAQDNITSVEVLDFAFLLILTFPLMENTIPRLF